MKRPATLLAHATLSLLLFWLPHQFAAAMTFTARMMKGEPIIIATGEIKTGDDLRLKAQLTKKNMHSAGYFAMALASEGGSVEAAFALSKLMDDYPINTYVAPGASCMSACAAIVFIAGKEHVAVPGAKLGFHGCFERKTKKIDAECNERIANHALEHGTAYGSVMAFIQTVEPGRVVWLDGKDADCWAINKYQISPEPPGYEKCVIDGIKRILAK